MAEVLNRDRLTSVLEAGQRREILDLNLINELLERSNGRRGVPLPIDAAHDLAGRRHLRISRERVEHGAAALMREFSRHLGDLRRVSSRP